MGGHHSAALDGTAASAPLPTRGLLRVRILDESPLVVQGLTSMLEPYRDRVQVLAGESSRPADVTLVDVSRRSSTGQGRLPALLTDQVHGRVVLYAWNPTPAQVDAALAQGFAGYLDKSAAAAEVMTVLQRVADGERAVLQHGRAPVVRLGGADSPVAPPQPGAGRTDLPAGLSPREAEMLDLIAQGLLNSDISARTYLSINTVKTYIRSA